MTARDILLDISLAPIGVACALARAGLHVLEGAVRVSEELHALADRRQVRVAELERAFEDLRALAETRAIEVRALRGDVERLARERNRAEIHAGHSEKFAREFQQERDAWRAKYESCHAELRQVDAERLAARSELAANRRSNERLRAKLDDVQGDHDELAERLTESRALLTACETDRARLATLANAADALARSAT